MTTEQRQQPARPRRREGGKRYAPRRKVCAFCADKVKEIDYKDVPRWRRFLSDRAKIEPRRKTGTCARHQRRLTVALKRARHVALLPFTADHIRVTGGSWRPERPERGGFERRGMPAPAPAPAQHAPASESPAPRAAVGAAVTPSASEAGPGGAAAQPESAGASSAAPAPSAGSAPEAVMPQASGAGSETE